MSDPYPRPSDEPRPQIRVYRDALGTLFAVQLIECARWDDALAVQPPVEVADVRIAYLGEGLLPSVMPPWVVFGSTHLPSADESWLLALARRLWLRSPYHRDPGAPSEDYVRATFHALCPPHPRATSGLTIARPSLRSRVTAMHPSGGSLRRGATASTAGCASAGRSRRCWPARCSWSACSTSARSARSR